MGMVANLKTWTVFHSIEQTHLCPFIVLTKQGNKRLFGIISEKGGRYRKLYVMGNIIVIHFVPSESYSKIAHIPILLELYI